MAAADADANESLDAKDWRMIEADADASESLDAKDWWWWKLMKTPLNL